MAFVCISIQPLQKDRQTVVVLVQLQSNEHKKLLWYLSRIFFFLASDHECSAVRPWWKTGGEDQQKPGALRHHVNLLQPLHGDRLVPDCGGHRGAASLFYNHVFVGAQRRCRVTPLAAVSDAERQARSGPLAPLFVLTAATQDINDYCSLKTFLKVMVWWIYAWSRLLLGAETGRRCGTCLKKLTLLFWVFFPALLGIISPPNCSYFPILSSSTSCAN